MLYTKINTSKSYSGGVLFVGSSDIKGTKSLADYSNMAGLSKDFFILTKELKRKYSGTSFTAPQISAVLAKLKAAFPEYRMKDCINLILASAELPKTIHPDDLKRFQNSTNLTDKQINKLIPSDVYGRGWANARKAYELGKALYPAPITLPSLNHKNDQMIQESLSDPFFFYQLLEEPNLDKAWNLFKSLLPEWDLFENYLKNSPEEKRETYMNFLNKILNYALANDLVETEDGSKLYDKISDAIFFIDFKL